MKAYTLIAQDMTTYGGFQWELGEWREATGSSNRLCTDGVLHHYRHPVLAAIFNPLHRNISSPRLFEVECSEEVAFDGFKGGSKEQRLIRELELPEITTDQLVELAIRVALSVYKAPEFVAWAEKWLSGEDRSAESAARAAETAWAAAETARAAETADWAAMASDSPAQFHNDLMGILKEMGLDVANHDRQPHHPVVGKRHMATD